MGLAADLLAAAVALLAIHVSVPLYHYATALRWSRRLRPRGADGGQPRQSVTVVVPTYMEAGSIAGKLEDVFSQGGDALAEVIVVDAASPDGTARVAEEWARSRGLEGKVRVLVEPSRRGKHAAENEALKVASGDVVVFTDADCLWERGALARALEWLADPSVGLVTCSKRPARAGLVEGGYRDLYNVVRAGESAIHSTPIAHGELLAVRRDLLLKLGGLRPGADDSDLAHRVAMAGLRAVAPLDVVCVESVPTRGYFMWRVRRAQHLVEHFARAVRDLPRAPRGYRRVLAVESFLHLANEWLALAAAALLASAAAVGSLAAAALLASLAALMALGPVRSWAYMQLVLAAASVRNLFTREYVWERQPRQLLRPQAGAARGL